MSDDIYYDMHMDDGGDDYEKSKFSKIVSLFFKSVAAIIVIAVFAILFYRMWSMREPSMSEDFLANDITVSSSKEHSGDELSSEYSGDGWYVDFRTFDSVTLKNHKNSKEITLSIDEYGYDGFQIFTHTLASYYLKNEETGEYETVERSEYYLVQDDDEGALKISNAYFMPQSGQLEVTFRFNNNVISNLYGSYPLAARDEGELFVYVISDNQGNKYTEYCYTEGTRANYNYRRLLFSGIDFKNVSTLYLDIYYINDVDMSDPYRSMIIYDNNISLDEYETKVPSSVTSGLIDMPKYITREDN